MGCIGNSLAWAPTDLSSRPPAATAAVAAAAAAAAAAAGEAMAEFFSPVPPLQPGLTGPINPGSLLEALQLQRQHQEHLIWQGSTASGASSSTGLDADPFLEHAPQLTSAAGEHRPPARPPVLPREAAPAPPGNGDGNSNGDGSRVLCRLSVFQHRQHTVLMKSVHLSRTPAQAVHARCQEFLLHPAGCTPAGEAMDSYFDERSVGCTFVTSLKALSIRNGWDIVLDYGDDDAPATTTMPPALRVSLNKNLACIPLLAHDLELVERHVDLRQMALQKQQQQQLPATHADLRAPLSQSQMAQAMVHHFRDGRRTLASEGAGAAGRLADQ
eukprot:jgi/Mesen1/10978/ME000096S10553